MAAVAETVKPSSWSVLKLALRNRKTGYMALFGFASGLPFALFLGTLYAWLSEAEVDLETMGVFSLIGLAYAFQFLWSPLVDRLDIPGLRRLGKRKQWIAPMQLLLGIILVTLSLLDPKSQLGWFSLLAGIGAFASATQDIVINAWRIDIADDEATIDILSTVTQMGFRLAALVGGALGLIIAERIGWPQTYVVMGVIMLGIGIAGLFAPDADVDKAAATTMNEKKTAELYEVGEIEPRVRNWALLAVGLLWGWAIVTVLIFMVRSLTALPEDRPDPTLFTATYGPLIIAVGNNAQFDKFCRQVVMRPDIVEDERFSTNVNRAKNRLELGPMLKELIRSFPRDLLLERLTAAGKASGEELWRLPLGPRYDKDINSEIADMKNVGKGREAGSVTAAQLLERFVEDTPWAHLDIAGMAWMKRGDDPTVPKGASGFGVRLLDKLVADYYES